MNLVILVNEIIYLVILAYYLVSSSYYVQLIVILKIARNQQCDHPKVIQVRVGKMSIGFLVMKSIMQAT